MALVPQVGVEYVKEATVSQASDLLVFDPLTTDKPKVS
jgi:hypothetical protein